MAWIGPSVATCEVAWNAFTAKSFLRQVGVEGANIQSAAQRKQTTQAAPGAKDSPTRLDTASRVCTVSRAATRRSTPTSVEGVARQRRSVIVL